MQNTIQRSKIRSADSRAKHFLNSSKAKAQYSFSKAKRFSNKASKSQSQLQFYDIQDTRHIGNAGFSKSDRTDFVKNDGVPSSTQYNIPTSLNKNGIGFKNGRQKCKSGCLFTLMSNSNPGPTAYEPSQKLMAKSIFYSMGKRYKTSVDHNNQQSTPGPKYNITSTMLDQNKVLSIYIRRNSTKICNPVSRKYEKNTMQINRIQTKKQQELDSRYITVKGQKKIGIGGHQTIIRGSNSKREFADKREETPGPGQYNSFSEFS